MAGSITLAALFSPAASAARANLLQNPVVFVEASAGSTTPAEDFLEGGRPDFCTGARLLIRDAEGEMRALVPDFYSSCEPDVSFDGKKILFAGQRAEGDFWNIFEIGVDGTDLRQVTRQTGNSRQPIYLSTFYTIVSTEPWYQISFVSDLAGEWNPDGRSLATHLYSCRLDGSEVRRLTHHPASDQDPFLMPDGRILFSSRQNLRRYPAGRQSLFAINSDGVDFELFTGHEGRRVKRMPTVTKDRRCVFVEAEMSENTARLLLSSVDLERNLHSYRALTEDDEGSFYSPAPLNTSLVLVSRRSGDEAFQVGAFDLEERRWTPLFQVPGRHAIQAKVVRERARPDGRSSSVSEDRPHGQLYALDIGIHDLPEQDWLTPETARRVRILEGLPQRQPRDEEGSTRLTAKRLLGEVPLREDGSFFVEVPANIPIQIQLLDEEGLALRSCSWIWVRNREARGCIGCHEDGELTPPNRLADAVREEPAQLTLSPHQRRFVDFRRDIVPIVEEGCARSDCHGSGGAAVDLTPQALHAQGEAYSETLYALLTEGMDGTRRGRWIDPGRARNSPLIWHLLGRMTARPWDDSGNEEFRWRNRPGEEALLAPAQLKKVMEWIDLGAHGGSRVFEAVEQSLSLDGDD